MSTDLYYLLFGMTLSLPVIALTGFIAWRYGGIDSTLRLMAQMETQQRDIAEVRQQLMVTQRFAYRCAYAHIARERGDMVNGQLIVEIQAWLKAYHQETVAFQWKDPQPERLRKLKQTIENHFDLAELEEVIFDLGLNVDNIAGATLASKIQGVIVAARNRGMLGELVQLLAEKRPFVGW